MALVQLTREDGIAYLTVNRPEVLNAIDVSTAWAISESVQALNGDVTVRCIVLRGAGRAFIAGGDLARFAEDFDKAAEVVDELLDALHPAILSLRSHAAPVVASVHGAVAGAGLSLMSACDLVIAAEGTRFMVAYDRVGASPDCGGTYFLPRVVGRRRAAEFMFLSDVWTAESALQAGLVNRVVPLERLAAETERVAVKIAAGPTQAYGAFKRLLDTGERSGLADHLERERAAFKAATKTADFRAGVSAFLSKGTPEFTGN